MAQRSNPNRKWCYESKLNRFQKKKNKILSFKLSFKRSSLLDYLLSHYLKKRTTTTTVRPSFLRTLLGETHNFLSCFVLKSVLFLYFSRLKAYAWTNRERTHSACTLCVYYNNNGVLCTAHAHITIIHFLISRTRVLFFARVTLDLWTYTCIQMVVGELISELTEKSL